MKNDLASALANRVRYLRRVLKLTQEEFAKRSCLPLPFVRRVERGEVKSPSLERLGKLAMGLDVQLAELFEVYEKAGDANERTVLIRRMAKMLQQRGIEEVRAVSIILREVFAIQRLDRK